MTQTLTLPSGRTAVLRPAIGRDSIKAIDIAARPGNQLDVTYALLSQILTIDGEPVSYEALLDWPMTELNPLLTAMAAPTSPAAST